jgi:fumarate hydratase class II
VEVAHHAAARGLSIEEATVSLGLMTADEARVLLDPRRLTQPDR